MNRNDSRSTPEILAPAGSAEALSAALHAGADAVYFGLDVGFNARARAANFTTEGLADTVRTIHRAGARAYLAVNTLIYEVELEALERILRHAAAAGVDALIVQDPAVALLSLRIAPSLEIHASTQMTVASAEAARFAAGLGATRVVLPRELSLPQIRQFVAESPLSAEVFVHGALCVSWSGQCLTSEVWGQRSANRGQCAQSCRMPYAAVLDGVVKDLGDVRYLLSPLDLAALPLLPELMALGLAGLKIEGRQKGAAYVASAVQSYREHVDALAAGEHPDATAALTRMGLTYSRGFSPGFLAGSNHQRLVEGRFPKHRGLYVGRVRSVDMDTGTVNVERDPKGRPWTGAALVKNAADAPVGDTTVAVPRGVYAKSSTADVIERGTGIVFEDGHPEDALEPGGPVFSVREYHEGWDLRFGQPGPDLRLVKPGQRVWATGDSESTSLTQSAGREPPRLGGHRIDLRVSGCADAPMKVHARCATGEWEVESTMPLSRATGAGIDTELLQDKLGSFGGSLFTLGTLDNSLPAGLHLPVGEMKRLRRECVIALEPLVAVGPQHAVNAEAQLPLLHAEANAARETRGVIATAPQLIALVRTLPQLEAVIECGHSEVELDFMDFTGLTKAVKCARDSGLSVSIATVRVQKPGEEAYDRRIESLQPDSILARHLGAVMHFAEHPSRIPVHGDFSLNVTNSLSAEHFFNLGLATLTASHDLDETQLFALLQATDASRMTVVVRQRMATFHMDHCVYAHLLSAGRDFNSCGRPCDQHSLALQDHLGRQHPVLVDVGCRNTVFNAEAQTNAPMLQRLVAAGVRRLRCEFVRESGDEVRNTLQAFDECLQGRRTSDALVQTLGLRVQQGVSHSSMELLV
ncbi:MAG: U32 family peptidase [Planctomycetes bacterium]|nr:U32 family peptidase [Planctomycetota bacterium]